MCTHGELPQQLKYKYRLASIGERHLLHPPWPCLNQGPSLVSTQVTKGVVSIPNHRLGTVMGHSWPCPLLCIQFKKILDH